MLSPIIKAISSLVGTKAPSVFLTPKIRDHVRAHVKEKDRAARILELIAQGEAIALEFRKNREEKLKQFWALQKDRNTPSEQLALLLHEDMTDHQMMQNKQVKIRVQAQRLIQPDEWEEIRKSALKTAQKTFEERQQVISDWNVKRLRIEAKAEKAIKELSRLREVRSILKRLWRQVANLTQARNVKPAAHPVLGNRESTEADLRQVIAEVNRIRQEAYDEFVVAHVKLAENITEKEWKKIF